MERSKTKHKASRPASKRLPRSPAPETLAPAAHRHKPDELRLSGQYRGRPAAYLGKPHQKKVAVGTPGDRYEREADHVSDQVSAGRAAGAISRIPPGGLGAQRKAAGAGEEEAAQAMTVQREPEGGEASANEEASAQTKCAACEAEDKAQKKDDTPSPGQSMSDGTDKAVQGNAGSTERDGAQSAPSDANEQGTAQTVQRSSEAPESSPANSRDDTAQAQSEGGNDTQGGGGTQSGAGPDEFEAPGGPTGQPSHDQKPHDTSAGEPELGCGGGGGESEGHAAAPGAGGQSCGGGTSPAAATGAPSAGNAGGGTMAVGAGQGDGATASEPGAPGNERTAGPGSSQGPCRSAQTKSEGSEDEGDTATAQHREQDGVQAKADEDTQSADEDSGAAQPKETSEAATSDAQNGAAQTKPAVGRAAPARDKGAIAAEAIRNRGAGEPLSPHVRDRLESGLGADLSEVRVHSDGHAHAANRGLRARAFTHKNHIWLGAGQSQSDLKLMAHEVAHTVQQGAVNRSRPAGGGRRHAAGESRELESLPIETETADEQAGAEEEGGATQTSAAPTEGPDTVQRAPASPGHVGKSAPAEEAGPEEVIELKGRKTFDDLPAAVATWMAHRPGRRKQGKVLVQYGAIAKGIVTLRKYGKHYTIVDHPSIPLNHPLFQRIGEVAPGLTPRLYLRTRGRTIIGHVGLAKGEAYVAANRLRRTLLAHTDIIGLAGLHVRLPNTTFLLKDGLLHIGPVTANIALGKVLIGTVTFEATDETLTRFDGQATVVVPGLANGSLVLKRDPLGRVVGQVALGVVLSDRFSGNVLVAWDGQAFSGVGEVGYTSEKLSGKVKLQVMEAAKAQALKEQKQAPAGDKAPAAKKKNHARAPKAIHYVVFGDGMLNFAFTDWLNGAAQVIVDPVGHVTIIGKITPQKEVTLFHQRDLAASLPKIPKLEARALYGIPVVGNIYVAAGIGIRPFAIVGPGLLRQIEVAGTYSTDPKVNQNFTLQANLNISASAGIDVTGEVKAGIVIIEHDIAAGGRVTGTAGVKGYVDANPIIGYREKGQPGQDKKGEFFIRGDMEIAAQAFVGLRGSLFISLDSPWWSPAPDKTWTWPLGEKQWPLGKTLGIDASVDYVLGSGQWPQLQFKPPHFSADKFLTDIVHDDTESKAGDKSKKPGKWKEKNSKAAEPPPRDAAKAPPKTPPIVAKGSSAKGKKTGTPVAGGGRTAGGKSVRALKAKAVRKGGPPAKAVGPATSPKGAKAHESKKAPGKDTHDRQLIEGLAALRAVTRRYAETGATREEVVTGVKSVRRKFRVFKSIEVIDGGRTWDYKYVACKGEQTGPKKAKGGGIDEWPRGTKDDPLPIKWYKSEGIYPTIGGKTPTEGVTLPRTARKDPLPLRVSPGNFLERGKLLKRRAPGRPEEPKKEDVKRRLDLERDTQGGMHVSSGDYAIDHVRDLSWYGTDTYTNLWPLPPKVNNAVNASHYQYVRARVGDRIETHSAKTWGTSKYFWIAKVVNPPGSAGGHGTSRKKPVNDGKAISKRKT